MKVFCASWRRAAFWIRHEAEETPPDSFIERGGITMAIDGMKVIDLDSHLVGDLESWEQTIEEQWRAFLPRKLPTKDNERGKALVGKRITVGSELGQEKAEKNEWVTPDELTPQGSVCNM